MGHEAHHSLSRLIVTVPRVVAEPFGAALVELGAGAVEERPTRNADTVEIVLTCPGSDPLTPWENAARCLYDVFIEELGVSPLAYSTRTERVNVNYHDAWLKHLTAVELTKHLFLAPVEDSTSTPVGQRRLVFTPHPSFGDGSHVTTRLAAQAVEAVCFAQPSCRVLDVGTGNGVLSLVAAAHGAHCLGLDIDPDAVDMAQMNARLNQLSDVCRFTTESVEDLTDTFDLVVANLEPLTQLELNEALAARVRPSKTLILTGFLEEQVENILEGYVKSGFVIEARQKEEEYVLLRLSAPPRVVAEGNE
jgi:ribosomal protein L11 methyltransferase